MDRISPSRATVALLIGLAIVLCGCASSPPGGGVPVRVERDVVYSPPYWPQTLRGDLYRPPPGAPAPAIVMVHGGGWDGRDRSDMASLSEDLAARGYAVLNIDYRLAPAYRYPAAVDDVTQAARWLIAHAQTLGIDASRLGGWGYSAGAHLVSLAAMRPGAPKFAAIVAGGMPSDLLRYPRSPLITAFIGASYAEAPALWREASPIAHVQPDSPPTFLYHGTWDRLVFYDDSVAMKRALDDAGVPAQLHAVRGLGHVATFLLGWGAREDAEAFLDAKLEPAAPPTGAPTTRARD